MQMISRELSKRSQSWTLRLAALLIGLTFFIQPFGLDHNEVMAEEMGPIKPAVEETEEELALEIEEASSEPMSLQEALINDLRRLMYKVAGFSFANYDQIKFRPIVKNPFVDNEADVLPPDLDAQHPEAMGRVAVPSIHVNGSVFEANTSNQFHLGLVGGGGESSGFGITNYVIIDGEYREDLVDFFTPTVSKPGQTTILGHRVFIKGKGFYDLDDFIDDEGKVEEQEIDGVMQEVPAGKLKEDHYGIPFYVDDYRIGKRFIYRVVNAKVIDATTLPQYVYADPTVYSENYGRVINEGNSAMLVVCSPRVYYAEKNRILVFGNLGNIFDIPEEDPYFQRYLRENGLTIEDIAEAKTAFEMEMAQEEPQAEDAVEEESDGHEG